MQRVPVAVFGASGRMGRSLLRWSPRTRRWNLRVRWSRRPRRRLARTPAPRGPRRVRRRARGRPRARAGAGAGRHRLQPARRDRGAHRSVRRCRCGPRARHDRVRCLGRALARRRRAPRAGTRGGQHEPWRAGAALARSARRRRGCRDYDIEIFEAHHRHKRDTPSGTALALGHAAAAGRGVAHEATATYDRALRGGPREPGSIGYAVVRAGDTIGEHSVWLAGLGERLTLSHSATDRATFARGALEAARFLAGRPAGRYQFADVVATPRG